VANRATHEQGVMSAAPEVSASAQAGPLLNIWVVTSSPSAAKKRWSTAMIGSTLPMRF